jgi:hypothetical protein
MKRRLIVTRRLESELISSLFIFLIVFGIHASTVFVVLSPILNGILFLLAISIGFINHYLVPNLRSENPWFFFNQPLLKPKHWSEFEANKLAHLTYFERFHFTIIFVEKNILNILLFLSVITTSTPQIIIKFSSIDPTHKLAAIIITIFSLKLIRHSFCEPSKQYKIFFISFLFNRIELFSIFANETKPTIDQGETILFNLFFVTIFLNKLEEFMDKISFIYTYTAPWQLPWGSAFHAFAQPLSLPHTGIILIQVIISCLISAPIMPLMGSAIFLMSYMRPVKFWERIYKTKRQDNSNTRLRAQFDGLTGDNENLNSIFYEHLTSVLSTSLCGDCLLGRWGDVQYGDFFILSSDYLNCLVHIVEIGNGFVTFQLRGLEFKGTYCQQRELEAITEDTTENNGCCCCDVGHFRRLLSFNSSFQLRWMAWRVIAKNYIVKAYQIVENDMSLIVNFFTLRKTLIDFYIKVSL